MLSSLPAKFVEVAVMQKEIDKSDEFIGLTGSNIAPAVRSDRSLCTDFQLPQRFVCVQTVVVAMVAILSIAGVRTMTTLF